jgi:hypothetical protein
MQYRFEVTLRDRKGNTREIDVTGWSPENAREIATKNNPGESVVKVQADYLYELVKGVATAISHGPLPKQYKMASNLIGKLMAEVFDTVRDNRHLDQHEIVAIAKRTLGFSTDR